MRTPFHLMHKKNRIALIPFIAVPQFEIFRFQGKFWKRKPGATNYAVCIENKNIHRVIEENVVVAIAEKNIRKQDHHYIIKIV